MDTYAATGSKRDREQETAVRDEEGKSLPAILFSCLVLPLKINPLAEVRIAHKITCACVCRCGKEVEADS